MNLARVRADWTFVLCQSVIVGAGCCVGSVVAFDAVGRALFAVLGALMWAVAGVAIAVLVEVRHKERTR